LEKRFEEILKEYEEEGREVRRREADWDFINKQPPRIRAALRESPGKPVERVGMA